MRRYAWIVAMSAAFLVHAGSVLSAVAAENGGLGPGAARATESEPAEGAYEPSAAAIAGAVAINVVYFPVRFLITLVGAEVGGIEGVLSAGNEHAAETIWSLTDGSQVITPAMLEGRERWTFSGRGW
jgi:hypothetical protein